MPHHRRNRFLLLSASTGLLAWLAVSPANAELRTITATGEYRMGDNDTRTDAKRLALMDAKRLALEQAGTYLESVTEVKNLQVSGDELRAYTAGIIEVIEQATQDVMEGATHIVRVKVTAQIDTAVVARQIDMLGKNENMKAELIRLRLEREQVRQELKAKTRELALLKPQAEIEAVSGQRQALIVKSMVNDLLGQANTAFITFLGSSGLFRTQKSPESKQMMHQALLRARYFTEQALALDPSNGEAQLNLEDLLAKEGGILIDEGNLEAAVEKFRSAITLFPDNVSYHSDLAGALFLMGNFEGALVESRAAVRLSPKDEHHVGQLALFLAATGDISGAIAMYNTIYEEKVELRHLAFGMTLKAYLDVAEHNPHYDKVRQRLPKKTLRETASKELRAYLKLVPSAPENQDMITFATTQLRELEK